MFATPSRNDGVTIPVIWIALALSLLIHAVVLLGWRRPNIEHPYTELAELKGKPLRLRLAPRPNPPAQPPQPPAVEKPRPAPRPAPKSNPPPRAAPSPAAPSQQAAPRPVAPSVPVVRAPSPAPLPPPQATLPPSPTLPAPRPAPPGMDFSTFVKRNQLARAEVQPRDPAEEERIERNRRVQADLQAQNERVYGDDPSKGGGVFQVDDLRNQDAVLLFRGWDADVGQRLPQKFEVTRGNYPDIRIAVVHKVFDLIHAEMPEDFVWHSHRLGKDLTLSARPQDRAGTEEVLMKELFD
jgi:hypothetical protein